MSSFGSNNWFAKVASGFSFDLLPEEQHLLGGEDQGTFRAEPHGAHDPESLPREGSSFLHIAVDPYEPEFDYEDDWKMDAPEGPLRRIFDHPEVDAPPWFDQLWQMPGGL